MSNKIPNVEELTTLVGHSFYDVWDRLCALIDEKYDLECLWKKLVTEWVYQYRYGQGDEVLCALCAKENDILFMTFFGKDERLKFEKDREFYSKEVQKIYDEAKPYGGGAWLIFDPVDVSLFDDYIKLLGIKMKSNRK